MVIMVIYFETRFLFTKCVHSTNAFFCYLFIFIVIAESVELNDIKNQLPLWNWECVNRKCIPIKPTKSVNNLQSLMTCKMLCTSPELWPLPTGYVNCSSKAVPTHATLFQIIASSPSETIDEFLRDAFTLFREDLFKLEKNISPNRDCYSVIVDVNVRGSSDPLLRLDTDESYQLSVYPNNTVLIAKINAHSFIGARNALETLSQFAWRDPYLNTLMILESANVTDAPRFRYRGLFLDTLHSYFPVNELLRTIDAMATCKLNTFHWHMSNPQVFSLLMDGAKDFDQRDVYEIENKAYTADDVRSVVSRAKLRGIRVILEVNLPSQFGRIWDWGPSAGLGHLVYCSEEKPWSEYCGDAPCGQLNPHNPHVYQLLEKVFNDVIQLSAVEDVFHIGSDDFSKLCWMRNLNITKPLDAWIRFTKSLISRIAKLTMKSPKLFFLRTSKLSNEMKNIFEDFNFMMGLQVHHMVDQEHLSDVRTIVSHEEVWDLNSGMGAWYESKGGAYNSWQRMYEHRPWGRSGGRWVEGGEVTCWSETLRAGGLDAQIWPRAAAVAERLWSDRTEGASRSVHKRLDLHRSRIAARGVQVAPIWSMWCTQNSYSCA